MAAKKGRPSTYTPELAKQICDLLSSGLSLRKTCLALEISKSMVLRWLKDEDKADFKAQYALAFDDKIEIWADESIDIADDGTNDYYPDKKGIWRFDMENVHRARLRVDTRKFFLERMRPKKYGSNPQGEENPKEKVTDVTIRIIQKPE